MKSINVISNILKLFFISIILILITVSLIYIFITPYPSSKVDNQLLNSNNKTCTSKNSDTNKTAILKITPNISYTDEEIAIQINGLKPFEIGTLKLSVTDSKKIVWESTACFKANENGEINPKNQAPLENSSYNGIHSMGLFWSLKPEKLNVFNFDTDLVYKLSFYTSNNQKLTDTIIRKTYSNIVDFNIKKVKIRNDLVANFYHDKTYKLRPTIVLLSGSGGNFQHSKAKYIAAKGYNVMDLKYFGTKGLPTTLENIPLEYLHKAINWLKTQSVITSSKIALMGRSKGAEYALIYASKYNDINAVISEVGSSVTWSSKRYFKSSWKYKGKSLPRAKGGLLEAIKYLKSSNGKAQNQLPYMLSAFNNTKRIKESSITIETISCPILLISGENDLQWPSTMMSNQIKVRAEKYNFKYDINHYPYKNAGHQFDELPFLPQIDFSNFRTWKSGGNFQGNALASIDSWKRIFTFLEKHLKKEN